MIAELENSQPLALVYTHSTSTNVGRTKLSSNRRPLEIFGRIKNFRSGAAIEYYQRNFGLTANEAVAHFLEMLKYLCLVAVHPGAITPSMQLDEVWHSMIIQTRDYQKLCGLIGIFVHHSTRESPQKAQYEQGLVLYQKYFGLPPEVWSSPLRERVSPEQNCKVIGWCSTCGDD